MDSLPRDDAQVRAVSHAVRQHLLLVVVVVAVFAVGAGGYLLTKSKSYVATTTLSIRPLAGNALSLDITNTDQNTSVALQTEANLVTSLAVTQRVNKALGTSLDVGSSTVAGNVPTNTSLIRITYTAPNAGTAERYARAYAKAFLAYRKGQANAVKFGQLTTLRKQESDARKLFTAAATAAAKKTAPAGAKADEDRYATRLTSIETQIGTVEAIDTYPGSVAVPAQKPAGAGILKALLLTIAGGLVGLVVGIALAVLRERRTDRIWSPSELAIGDLPIIAAIPHANPSRNEKGRGPDSVRTDALRRSRVGILAATRPPIVIAVAAPAGTSSTAGVTLDLAHSLTAADYRVVVVDATLTDSGLTTQLGIPANYAGLSDAVLGDTDLAGATQQADGLRVVPAGANVAAAREKYSGPALASLLREACNDAHYVFVICPPARTGDGLAVIRAVDTVLLVATEQATTHDDVTQTADACRRLGVETLGVVLQPRVPRGRRGHRGRSVPPPPPPPAKQSPTVRPAPTRAAQPAGSDGVDEESTRGVDDAAGAREQGAETRPEDAAAAQTRRDRRRRRRTRSGKLVPPASSARSIPGEQARADPDLPVYATGGTRSEEDER